MKLLHSEDGVQRRRGFTLIETILAVSILSISLSVLLVACSRCLLVMKASMSYKKARWTLDKGYVDNPVMRSDELDEMEVHGVEYDGMTFSREVERMDEEEGEEDDYLYIIRSKVTWSRRGNEAYNEVVRCVLHKKAKK